MAIIDLTSQYLTATSLLIGATSLLVLWGFQTAIYRLYFSPIAKFPGPKLAALTLWYEFYYDVWLGGQYVFKMRELHEQYGPIIRISPYELHVLTPSFYEELYAGSGKKRNKYDWWTKWAANYHSAWGTIDHDLHRMRRSAINPFFSKQSVRRLQPIIQERVDMLLSRIKSFQNTSNPVNLKTAFVALSADVIASYAFGHSYRRLEHPEFDPLYAQSMHDGAAGFHFNKQIHWPIALIFSIPPWLASRLIPGTDMFFGFVQDCEKAILAIKKNFHDPELKTGSHPTLFRELMDADLPESEKSVKRLVQEAQIVVLAGTETTGWCLSVITFHLLSNPSILAKLRKELEDAIPDPYNLGPIESIEQLPYLSAIIQEGLRLSYGVATRLPRIAPVETMIFDDGEKEWLIPPGTPTSMTSYLLHHDTTIFPDPYTFNPQRWVDNPRLDKYLVSFSKGTRQCVGINLSYAELYTTLACLFRRYGGPGCEGVEGKLELFETDIDDVEMVADMFLPFVKKGSKGIRVSVV